MASKLYKGKKIKAECRDDLRKSARPEASTDWRAQVTEESF